MKKICYAASSGGHLEELLGLIPLKDRYASCLITEQTSFKPDVWQRNSYSVPAVNRRDRLCYLKLLRIFFSALFVFLKEKPDVVVSTGALMTVPVCLLAKMLRKKLVYIESIARVRSGSATGLWVYPFADLFVIQWEELRAVYPNAVYGGRLI